MIILIIFTYFEIRFLKIYFILIYMNVFLCGFMYMNKVPVKDRRGCWSLWSWSYRRL